MKTLHKPNEDFIPTKVILFVLFLAMLWGGNAVSLKIGLKEVAPLASAGLRFSIADVVRGLNPRTNRRDGHASMAYRSSRTHVNICPYF